MLNETSLQERYSPNSVCFGCGPANPNGLHIRSYPRPDGVTVAKWRPQPHNAAFPGVLNGGIVGVLLDCHSNWAAAWHLMQRDGKERPPCTVTADFAVRLLRPTPIDAVLELEARVVESAPDRARVDAKLIANGKTCATFVGTFVAVEPGHPAYHRW